MIAVPLGPRQRSAVVGSPEYFERWPKPTAPQQLRDLPCIAYRSDGGIIHPWEFERGGVAVSIAVDGPLCMTGQDLMPGPALAGTGLAYLFEAQVEAAVAEGRPVRVLEDWCPYYPGFYLYYPSRRQLPLVLPAFVDFCRGAAPAAPAGAAVTSR